MTQLTLIAIEALDSKLNNRPNAEQAREQFLAQLKQAGISPNLAYLLAKEGIFDD
jgi:hypothetical protein